MHNFFVPLPLAFLYGFGGLVNAIARLALLPLRVQMSSEDSMSTSESLKEIQGFGVRKLTKTIK